MSALLAVLLPAVILCPKTQAAQSSTALPSTLAGRLYEDTRLRIPLIVRLSRTTIADLLERLSAASGVHLAPEGEDVADQKIDLFTHGQRQTAAEILHAVTALLNAEGPGGYRWVRSGRAPECRYTLTRDLASRQWEAGRATEAARCLPDLLRSRFVEVSNEPTDPNPVPGSPLPGMKKLLGSLSPVQVARLISERHVVLTPETCEPPQRALLQELVRQLVDHDRRRYGERFVGEEQVAKFGPPETDPGAYAVVDLAADAPYYRVAASIYTTGLGLRLNVCQIPDAAAMAQPTGREADRPLPTRDAGPIFALPPRSSWLMGDVLADIAARARLNLIADDYTQSWSKLSHYQGARSLSDWLQLIRNDYGYAIAPEGAFLRLRNRLWWQDRRREIPSRLLTRWAELLRGSPQNRVRAAVEAAHLEPCAPDVYVCRDRLQILAQSPEVSRVCPSFANTIAFVRTGLLIYELLPPSAQQEASGSGLTITWEQMSQGVRDLFTRSVRESVYPGLSAENLHKSSLFLRFSSDRLLVQWILQGISRFWAEEGGLEPSASADPAQLVGKPAPALGVEGPAGEKVGFGPPGPRLIYIAPAWPRPFVAREEGSADLQSLERISQEVRGLGVSVLGIGTEATTTEIRGLWQERGINLPPRVLTPNSADALGLQHLPVALIVDSNGTVAWAKERYSPGDEATWRSQLYRVRGR